MPPKNGTAMSIASTHRLNVFADVSLLKSSSSSSSSNSARLVRFDEDVALLHDPRW